MYNLEDEILSAQEEATGRKIILTVHGNWASKSILRAVCQIIIEKRTGKIQPDKMIDLLSEAERAIVRMYGAPVIIPKQESVEVREPVKEKKAYWFDNFGSDTRLALVLVSAWLG
jgi:hypothetical protein